MYNEDSEDDVVPLLRRFVTTIREKQDSMLELANGKRKLLTLSPAFEWAQDLNSVAMMIKFAHRLDSPSCIDISDQNVNITDTHINVSCMCKRSDGTHRYILNHELFEPINSTQSYHEFQSAGRLYVNMTKTEAPKRWRRLLKSEERPQNMRIWHSRLEEIGDIEDHTIFETDDAFEDLVHIEKPKNKSKKKGKKKKKRRANRPLIEVKNDL